MEDSRSIRVQFFTKQRQCVACYYVLPSLNWPRYTVTDTPIAIPVHVRRRELSEMINHLLGLGEPPCCTWPFSVWSQICMHGKRGEVDIMFIEK